MSLKNGSRWKIPKCTVLKAGIQPYKRPSSTLIKAATITMSATVKHQVGLIAQNFENDVTEKCGYTIYFLGHKRRERERERDN